MYTPRGPTVSPTVRLTVHCESNSSTVSPTVSKPTHSESTVSTNSVPVCRPEKILGRRGPKHDFLCFLAPLEELGGSKNQANNSTSICEKAGFLMLCLDPFS